MATYNAPIDDMMFLFEKLRDNPHYNELEKYKRLEAKIIKLEMEVEVALDAKNGDD